MKLPLICILFLLTIHAISAQDDPYDIGWNPNGYLKQKHTVEHCVKNKQFDVQHLWVKTETSYQLFITHADKFARIDSLTIGGNLVCAAIQQLEQEMLKDVDKLPHLPELEFLSINMLSMENPFKNLDEFTHLKYLEIGGSFTQIPEEVWALTGLRHLNLYGYFTTVSPKVNQLNKLESLVLQGKYKQLPLPKLPLNQLTYLNLSGNLATTPQYITYCPNLRFLEIISDIPMQVTAPIGSPKNLEVLILTNNVILDFSDAIANLQELRELHLSCTWLDQFPKGICNLQKLEELRLDVMCLDEELEDYYGKKYSKIPQLHIPKSISQLSKLEWIDLTGRNVSEADIKIILAAFPDADVEYGPWE